MRKEEQQKFDKICESRNGKRLAENDSTELVVSNDGEGIVCGFIFVFSESFGNFNKNLCGVVCVFAAQKKYDLK